MTTLPITHMTLYKHGVGFFERRAKLTGQEVKLSFRVEEMNDILKSLTAIDWGGGQVLGIDYATPQSREERLAGCSIRLGGDRSLRDLLPGLKRIEKKSTRPSSKSRGTWAHSPKQAKRGPCGPATWSNWKPPRSNSKR